jgi:uncharacterized protein
MVSKVFINLPVKDLKKSMAFFSALGYEFNMQFTNELAACMVISEHNFAMLLTHEHFKAFTKKPIADAHTATEVIIALDLESKEKVDAIVKKATKHGAIEPREMQDLGFMYSRAIEDCDGHIWEFFWMDPNFISEQE